MTTSAADRFDRVFRAMSHRYRRRLLAALSEHTPRSAVEDLDFDITHSSNGRLVLEHDTTTIQTVHQHLPMLSTYGYTTWDRNSGELSQGPNWDEIKPILVLLYKHDDELDLL